MKNIGDAAAGPITCRLFVDPPASGAWNMAVDEVLRRRCRRARDVLAAILWVVGTDAVARIFPELTTSGCAPSAEPAVPGGPPGERRRRDPARRGNDLQPGDSAGPSSGRRFDLAVHGGPRGAGRSALWRSAGGGLLPRRPMAEKAAMRASSRFFVSSGERLGDVLLGDSENLRQRPAPAPGCHFAARQFDFGAVGMRPRTVGSGRRGRYQVRSSPADRALDRRDRPETELEFFESQFGSGTTRRRFGRWPWKSIRPVAGLAGGSSPRPEARRPNR